MGRSVPEVMAELAATGLSPYQLALITELAVASASSGNPADKRAEKLRAYDRERKRKSRGNPSESSGNPAESTEIASTTLREESINKDSKKKEEAKSRRSSGHPLPDGWQPHARHYATGEALGMDRAEVDFRAARMRNWARANQHRAVARKADWDAAFYNFLTDKKPNGVADAKPRNSRTSPHDTFIAAMAETVAGSSRGGH
jgi:hypothetical protein